MIAFSRISKQYGRRLLFVDASFQLNPGEKVGLVGPNGAGKTTLFRMIVGEEHPDDGDVSVPKKLSIGYFRQEIDAMSGRSVLDESIAGSGRLGDLHHELERLEHALAEGGSAAMESVLARFGEVQEEYQQRGGYELEARAREVLHGLGFEDPTIDGDVGALSGGWKMRVSMAKVLLGNPDVLLLDEPTNHLDIESIVWLEGFLRSSPASLLMTCHDRDFMNRVVSRIVEVDGGELVAYSGDYDFYEREREQREAQREAAYARQQAMLAKEQRFIERFSAHAAKAAQVQSRVKKLEKIEPVELPRRRKIVAFEFARPSRSGDEVAALSGVTKGYGNRLLYDGFDFLVRRGERWCVMGKNGAGKTTLLKMVAGALPPDSGSVRLGASLTLGYFAQQALELLDPSLTVLEQIDGDFPHESPAAIRNLLGVPVLGRRRRETRSSPVGRRALPPRDGSNALSPPQFPGPRRADEPSGSRDERDARRGAFQFRGHDALRVARPHVPPRPRQSRARGRRRHAAHLPRVVFGVRRRNRPRGSGRPRVVGRATASHASLRKVEGNTRFALRTPEAPRQSWTDRSTLSLRSAFRSHSGSVEEGAASDTSPARARDLAAEASRIREDSLGRGAGVVRVPSRDERRRSYPARDAHAKSQPRSGQRQPPSARSAPSRARQCWKPIAESVSMERSST
jgi:ATPase subunit of ABC transporter with duplicated ATPase domains